MADGSGHGERVTGVSIEVPTGRHAGTRTRAPDVEVRALHWLPGAHSQVLVDTASRLDGVALRVRASNRLERTFRIVFVPIEPLHFFTAILTRDQLVVTNQIMSRLLQALNDFEAAFIATRDWLPSTRHQMLLNGPPGLHRKTLSVWTWNGFGEATAIVQCLVFSLSLIVTIGAFDKFFVADLVVSGNFSSSHNIRASVVAA